MVVLMNRSLIIVITGGLFFALLAAFAVQMIGGKKQPTQISENAIKKVEVLFASSDMKTGHELGATDMKWVPWPEDQLFAGAVVRKDKQSTLEALDGRTRRAINKGEPMMEAALVSDKDSNFVAAALAEGKRAVAISVNAQSSVAGFVTPGSYVDVILTYDVKLPGDEKIRAAAVPVVTKLAAETIIENVKVLAVDQETAKRAEAKLIKTVTLELDTDEAEVLTLASNMGKLSLSLRSLGDDRKIAGVRPDGKPRTATTDMRVSHVMKEILRSGGENNTGGVNQVVRIYNGTRVDSVEVRPYSY